MTLSTQTCKFRRWPNIYFSQKKEHVRKVKSNRKHVLICSGEVRGGGNGEVIRRKYREKTIRSYNQGPYHTGTSKIFKGYGLPSIHPIDCTFHICFIHILNNTLHIIYSVLNVLNINSVCTKRLNNVNICLDLHFRKIYLHFRKVIVKGYCNTNYEQTCLWKEQS